MAEADGGNEIETTLEFDIGDYKDSVPRDRVAEAVIERGDRLVFYYYDISHEGEEDELQVVARYFLGGELRNESNPHQTYPVEDGVVYHTDDGQDLEEFIEANASSDPEVALTDEFESMVEVDS